MSNCNQLNRLRLDIGQKTWYNGLMLKKALEKLKTKGEDMNPEKENSVPVAEQVEKEQIPTIEYALTEDGTVVKAEDLPKFVKELQTA